MKGNSVLNKAKHSIDTDEWYTDYKTIEEEIKHYHSQFTGKTVLCNCDDPYESAFSRYFLKNFNVLKLKKLIVTSYKYSKVVNSQKNHGDFCGVRDKSGLVLETERFFNKHENELSDDDVISFLNRPGTVKKLRGDGDFRSDECIEFLKQSDVIVTNPPFSKFTELFSILNKYEKKYLLIGNQNAITYKEIFPNIKNGTTWIGYHFGDMSFKVPADTPPRNTRFWVDSSGQKWRSLGNAMWLTNLDTTRKHTELVLTETYSPEKYPRYDKFDAINVSRVINIPKDFEGIMGVPLTYLKYHNEEQFEIIGEANHGSDNEYDLFKPTINGKEIYKRILIRNKKVKEEKEITFNVLDLFCGAGGMSHGLHMNPHFSTKVALDIDARLAETYMRNMPEVNVVIGDICNPDIKNKVIDLSKRNDVNMIVGGPPCQGYSLKGKKLGLEDPRNFLFTEYLSIVETLKPEVFVIENVKSLLSTSNGWFKNQIVETIEKLGYFVSVGVLKSSDFGVPQTRERAIFICSKNKQISLPLPTISKPITVREAIDDLAYLESNEGDFVQEYKNAANSDYQKLMRKDCKLLYNHKASNHAQIAIDKLRMIPPEKGKEYLPLEMLGKQKFNTTWGRLTWDSPSPTIDTRFDASSNGRNNHPFLNRAITPREAARLQSFDDNYVFYGNKVAVRTQIGNAVPPLLAKAIADSIYLQLGKKTKKGG